MKMLEHFLNYIIQKNAFLECEKVWMCSKSRLRGVCQRGTGATMIYGEEPGANHQAPVTISTSTPYYVPSFWTVAHNQPLGANTSSL